MKNKTGAPRDEETLFLNVDVDVYGRTNLQPLVAALGEKAIVHYVGRQGREQSAHFSLASTYGKGADSLTYRFAGLIQRLPRPARRLWDGARRRDFNVGIQAGMKPYSHEIAISKKTLERLIDVGGRLVITTYAPGTPHRHSGRL